jgi:hypothetical protein
MEKGAKLTGIVTFIVGMVLLAIAFSAAYALYRAAGAASVPRDYKVLTSQIVGLLAQGLFLFVMGSIGSMIASRGIQLYSAAGRDEPHDRAAEE